ncbi:hypothetical protein RchiOBHm_Chr3g0451461 [Rosa chinensis]|uniref:Uncharacterized protein n=1 Tax=Rosa chinensis TaxID=74649 RepID=A0A2P6R626_ROSCH|nr:hypothetical protein RchiOBHm_Chr3g0451461 [Rosa chinensis]
MTHVIVVDFLYLRCTLWIFPRRVVAATSTAYYATSTAQSVTAHGVVIFSSPTCGFATTCARSKVAVSFLIGAVVWTHASVMSLVRVYMPLISRVPLLAPFLGCIIIRLTNAFGSYGP